MIRRGRQVSEACFTLRAFVEVRGQVAIDACKLQSSKNQLSAVETQEQQSRQERRVTTRKTERAKGWLVLARRCLRLLDGPSRLACLASLNLRGRSFLKRDTTLISAPSLAAFFASSSIMAPATFDSLRWPFVAFFERAYPRVWSTA